jgi:hypothetical protein
MSGLPASCLYVLTVLLCNPHLQLSSELARRIADQYQSPTAVALRIQRSFERFMLWRRPRIRMRFQIDDPHYDQTHVWPIAGSHDRFDTLLGQLWALTEDTGGTITSDHLFEKGMLAHKPKRFRT